MLRLIYRELSQMVEVCMKLKELVEKYGEQEVLCWAERADESLEWVNIKLGKPNPKTVWDLEKGDNHYWVDSLGKVKYNYIWEDDESDKLSREIGNVFLTSEDAEKDVERRKVEALLLKYGGRRWLKEGTKNWIIALTDDGLNRYIYSKPIQGVIYFDAEEQAKKAISEIGEGRLKKALFEVR